VRQIRRPDPQICLMLYWKASPTASSDRMTINETVMDGSSRPAPEKDRSRRAQLAAAIRTRGLPFSRKTPGETGAKRNREEGKYIKSPGPGTWRGPRDYVSLFSLS